MRTRTEKAKLDIAKSEYNKVKIDLEEAKIMLEKFGSDSLREIIRNYKAYLTQIQSF